MQTLSLSLVHQARQRRYKEKGDNEMEECEANEVATSMEEEAGSDQLALEKCGKEKVAFINQEEIEISRSIA